MIIRPLDANASHNVGGPVDIICEATGKPAPNVTWIHKGQVKSSGSQTAHLTFSAVRKDDAGTYTCKASNSVGSAEKVLNLVINCKYTSIQRYITELYRNEIIRAYCWGA